MPHKEVLHIVDLSHQPLNQRLSSDLLQLQLRIEFVDLARCRPAQKATLFATLTPVRSHFFQIQVRLKTFGRLLGNDVRQRVRKHVVAYNFILRALDDFCVAAAFVIQLV